MTLLTMYRPKRERIRRSGAARTALALVLMATVAGVAGACGSSSQAKSAAAQGSTQSVQTMLTVKRANLVATLSGKLTLTVTAGRATGTATFSGDGASQVVTGQTVTVVFMGQAGSAGQGSLSGSARPSVAPSAPSGVQGSPPSGGASGSARGGFSGKTATGTVSSVQHNSDGSATVQITIGKLPTGVTAKSVGMATINAGVLARNVLIVPTAAIKGSGSNATVQVIVSGQTTTRKVVVGKQTQAESEIVSGLSAGDNVVYERTMRGGLPGAGGAQQPGQAPPAQSGSQSNGVGSGT